jgi:hypothetical protein
MISNEVDLDEKLKNLAALGAELDALAAKKKEVEAQYDALNFEITQYFQLTETQSKALAGNKFYLTSRTFVKIEDQERFEQWVEEKQAYKLVMARHAGKLQAYCDECIQNQLEIPDGVTPGFIKHSIAIRKA